MNFEMEKELFKKYMQADSTLDEEQQLFNLQKHSHPGLEAWSSFVQRSKKTAPTDYNNSLWNADLFTPRKKYLQKYMIGIAAFILIVIIALLAKINTTTSQSIEEKEALLAEAMLMTSQSPSYPLLQDVIYEDDILIIYTSNH